MPETTTASAEIEVVRAFFTALERNDIDGVLALAEPETVYQNVPLPPARGTAAFEVRAPHTPVPDQSSSDSSLRSLRPSLAKMR